MRTSTLIAAVALIAAPMAFATTGTVDRAGEGGLGPHTVQRSDGALSRAQVQQQLAAFRQANPAPAVSAYPQGNVLVPASSFAAGPARANPTETGAASGFGGSSRIFKGNVD